MTLVDSPGLATLRARLGPYLDGALERAADQARRLHAGALALEHLLLALLEDQDSALNRLVEHAFADSETLLADVLAIAPGILVVGSGATLPFSPKGVAAVREARARAARRGAGQVTPADVLLTAATLLEPGAGMALGSQDPSAGAWEGALSQADPAGPAADPVREEGHLFHHFSPDARRALSGAGRVARRAGAPAIAPAHLLVATLEVDGTLAQRLGLTAGRAAQVLRPYASDPSRPASDPIPPEPGMLAFLAALPPGAGSLDVLGRLLADPSSEQAQVFARQKVTSALLARARGAIADPDPLDRTGERGL